MTERRRGNPNWRKDGPSPNPSGRSKQPKPREPRTDGYINALAGHGTDRDRRMFTTHTAAYLSEWESMDLRRGNWLARRICELMPDEALRRGYDLKLDTKDTAEKVQAAIEDLCINERIVEAGQMERTVGGAALLPVLDGALGDMSEPLDLARVLKLDAVHVLEPRELVPMTWYNDMRQPGFRRPETYRIAPLMSAGGAVALNGAVIHESRLAILPGRRVSVQILPGQRSGWGDNELAPVAEQLADFGLSWGSAASIMHDFAQGIYGVDGLAEMLKEADGEELLQKHLRALDMGRSSVRAAVIDNKSTFSRSSTPVSGLSDLLIQQAQFIAGIADIPLTVLFGMSPAGLNATGESDIRGWYDRIGKWQRAKRHVVEWLVRLLLISSDGPTNGKEPETWSIEWKPLWSPSDKETAESRLIDSQADKNWYDMGAASSDDIAKSHWGGDTYSRDIQIDWKAREAQAKLDEQKAAELDAASLAAMGRVPVPADSNAPVPVPPVPVPPTPVPPTPVERQG